MDLVSGQCKILVVDGEEVILRYIPLQFQECLVLTARQGAEALRFLQDHPDISVLMADPDAAGYPFLEFCGTKLPRMRQIILTRASDTAGPPQAFNSAFRVLMKPCHESDLVQAVRQALATAAPAAPEKLSAGGAGADPTRRIKEELVAVAAHELRAPLGVIQGYAGILLESEPGLSPEGRETVRRIGDATRRLLGTVSSLLNLAASEAGMVELSHSQCRPGEVVSTVFDTLRGLMEERNVHCRLEVEGEDLEVSLDCGKVEQILLNLVSNAVKFNVPGGSVSITVRTRPHQVAFTVRDTGTGIAPEDVPRVFDKFTRFATGGPPGSGLGLAIAKAFVELHGGEIRLESALGQGSAFHFTVVPGHRGSKLGPLLA